MTSSWRDFVEAYIDHEALADYLTAQAGHYLGVYQDGKVVVGQDVGMEIDPEERPIAMVKCPGDDQLLHEDWEPGATPGLSLVEMVREGCRLGDVESWLEELRTKVIESLEERP